MSVTFNRILCGSSHGLKAGIDAYSDIAERRKNVSSTHIHSFSDKISGVFIFCTNSPVEEGRFQKM